LGRDGIARHIVIAVEKVQWPQTGAEEAVCETFRLGHRHPAAPDLGKVKRIDALWSYISLQSTCAPGSAAHWFQHHDGNDDCDDAIANRFKSALAHRDPLVASTCVVWLLGVSC
jgi:hypothetical protein